jgi:hypothetical protein
LSHLISRVEFYILRLPLEDSSEVYNLSCHNEACLIKGLSQQTG